MQKQLLITFSNNYADEFDVEGFLVLSEPEWLKHRELAARIFKQKLEAPKADPSGSDDSWSNRRAREVSVGSGTNEEITYYSLDDYLGSFKVKELTQEQYKVLWDLFGVHTDSYSYGTGKNKVTVPARDKIENGMLCLLDEDHLDEDSEDED